METLPVSVDRLEIEFKFGESSIKKASRYSSVKQFKEIDKGFFLDFVTIIQFLTQQKIRNSGKELAFTTAFILNGEEHILAEE